MKFFAHILILMVLLTHFSCTSKKDKEILNQLDRIKTEGNTNPSEALAHLDSLSSKINGSSTYVQNKYNLLLIRLQDKSDIIPLNDIQAKLAFNYFEKHGDINERAEASYYLASVYRDLHDSPRAVQYFTNALSLVEKSSHPDSLLLINIYSQLIYLYHHQLNHKDALELAKKELQLTESLGAVDPRSLADLSYSYYCLKDTANNIKYQDKALLLLQKEKDLSKDADILSSFLSVYSHYFQEKQATICKNLLETVPKEALPPNYNVSLGGYYKRFGDIDSAIVCYTKAYEQAKRVVDVCDATQSLIKLYALKGNDHMSSQCALIYADAVVKLRDVMQVEQATNVKNEYVYQRNLEEENKLIQEAAQTKQLLMLCLFFLFVAVLTIIIVILSTRLRRLKREQYIREIEQSNQETKEQLQIKQEQLVSVSHQKDELYKIAIGKKMTADFANTYEKVIKAANGYCMLKENDWARLFDFINTTFPNFQSAVSERLKKPNNKKMRICYLMKLGLSNNEIAAVVGIAPSTAWRKVKEYRIDLDDALQYDDEEEQPL